GSAASAAIPLPRWNVGDEWAYREETPAHVLTFVWSVDDIEIVDGVEHYVVKSGTRRIYYRSTDGALMLQKISGAVVNRYTPAGQAIALAIDGRKDLGKHVQRRARRGALDRRNYSGL